jgi:hypothetical protein
MVTGKNTTPFHDQKDNLTFPYRAVEGKCFIYPCPPPETLGKDNLISIPQEYQEYYQDGTGILLSIGPGYYDKKNKWNPTDPKLKPGVKVFFDKTVPWEIHVYGNDRKRYRVVVCTEADIYGVVEDE